MLPYEVAKESLESFRSTIRGYDQEGLSELLWYVCSDTHGKVSHKSQKARLLLDAGAVYNSANGDTCLHKAVKFGINLVKTLVQLGHIDINQCGRDGDTALHRALTCCPTPVPVIEYLLSHEDIDLSITNESGETPLHVALNWDYCQLDDTFIRKSLMNKMDVTSIKSVDQKGNTALMLALRRGRGRELVSAMVEKGAIVCDDTVAIAIDKSPLDVLEAILDVHPGVTSDIVIRYLRDTSDFRSDVFLRLVERIGNDSIDWGKVIRTTVAKQNFKVLGHILSTLPPNGFDFSSLVQFDDNDEGMTVLHEACAREYISYEVIELLLANGSDPNMPDARGRTPLMILLDNDRRSCREDNKSLTAKCIALLISRGADPNKPDPLGLVAGHYARRSSTPGRSWSIHQVLESNPARLIRIVSQIKRENAQDDEIVSRMVEIIYRLEKVFLDRQSWLLARAIEMMPDAIFEKFAGSLDSDIQEEGKKKRRKLLK